MKTDVYNLSLRNILLMVLSIAVFSGCSEDDEPEVFTPFQLETISYFQDIALGFEFGQFPRITRKWKTPMKLYVGGVPSAQNLDELTKIIGEINALSTDGFEIEQVADSTESNYYIYFGDATTYASYFPEIASFTASNWGLFYVFFNQRAELVGGHMYVDINRADAVAQRHLLREELTQSIGLARDSPRYANSIFQSAWTTTLEYADIDRELIRLLYHPDMVVGLNALGAEAVIQRIFIRELPD